MSGPQAPSRHRRVLGAAVLGAVGLLSPVVLSGCRSASRQLEPRAGAEAAVRGERVGAPADAAATAHAELWRLRTDELWTQRLFRMYYDGPEGDGGFKLTLRLASPELFQMSAVDRLTRRWFGLSVNGDEALFLDHRAKTFCTYGGEIEIAAVPLGPLPLRTLPALLLGRLPLEAVGPEERSGNELAYHDARGRRWTAQIEDGAVASWILWGNGEPAVWWQRQGKALFLSAREEGLQLRWREVVEEPMSPPLEEIQVPAEYTPGDCS